MDGCGRVNLQSDRVLGRSECRSFGQCLLVCLLRSISVMDNGCAKLFG